MPGNWTPPVPASPDLRGTGPTVVGVELSIPARAATFFCCIPSRAGITDAAMGERAECVMLNKGPYLLDAVRALDNILTRMQTHQRKEDRNVRQLGIAERFFGAA